MKEAQKRDYRIPQVGNLQIPHFNLLRKVQCHGGWDWGICLAVSGIYRSIFLRAESTCKVKYVYTSQTFKNDTCILGITLEYESIGAQQINYSVNCSNQILEGNLQTATGNGKQQFELKIHNPKRWWPNGLGEQNLYTLDIQFGQNKVCKQIGFRTIECITQKDYTGESFYFKVNGQPIFCKGANWIPCDALPSRQTHQKIDNLLQSAVDANMNMLRVWGGGQYEEDYFYQRCDELGLLLWHDLIFSCSLYPSDETFLESIYTETVQQIKRLRDHASIALWCGDNECLGALHWYEESKKNRDRYLVDYDRWNYMTLRKAVAEADETRRYWPSSPSAGLNQYADHWTQDNSGDMHSWAVWFNAVPFTKYTEIKPRFCSEFGFQSFPSTNTLRQFLPEDQWNINSPSMEAHQKSKVGNSRIIETFFRYFRFPKNLESHVYLSQLQQALAIKTAVEYWRSLRPHCMGTLYWQLNDNWPVVSWSSLEYSGQWKQLHYHAKRFYAPLQIVGQSVSENEIEICLLNDTLNAVDYEAEANLWSWQAEKEKVGQWKGKLQAASVLSVAKYILPSGKAADHFFLELKLSCKNVDQKTKVEDSLQYKSDLKSDGAVGLL